MKSDNSRGLTRRTALVSGATTTALSLWDWNGRAGSRGSCMAQSPNAASPAAEAPPPRASGDRRLGELKDLDGYFPLVPPASLDAWEKRRAIVLRQTLVSCGLWPMPSRPPVDATVHGRVERDGYTVDRVLFESCPGLLVTGSLYLPARSSGTSAARLPTILCPHGHWPQGRFHDHGAEVLEKEIASGAEQFAIGGRHPLQARCVHLARMGCAVFLYDMQGYADGGSLPAELVHGFAKQRGELNSPEHWGLFSAQSELRLISALGLQTWNSVRALDWLVARDDVDPKRIGVTGASGGGTQSFILAAIDDRIAAAFPAVMVSTAMQGGCTCENASYLRVNTGNIELAGLIAPRPLGMTGADDWTVDIESKGLPELRQLYALYGKESCVSAKYFKFPHNYNAPSRRMMYEFFDRHLDLGATSFEERDFVPLSVEEATVFNERHPAPPKTEVAEVALLQAWDQASNDRLAEVRPTDRERLAEFRRIVGGAYESMIGRPLPAAAAVEYEMLTEVEHDAFKSYTAWLRLRDQGEELPAAFLFPHEWNRQVVVWISGVGKRGVHGVDGQLRPAIAKLVGRGFAIATVDLLYQGDFLLDGKPLAATRAVSNPREFLGYTTGYNHPLFAQRVHDILTLLSFVKHHEDKPQKIHLAGVDGAGTLVATANAVALGGATSLAVDTEGFRFAMLTDIRDVRLLPGTVKYGDVPALLALSAPTPLLLAGEQQAPSWTADAYRVAAGRLDMSSSSGVQWPDAVAEWVG